MSNYYNRSYEKGVITCQLKQLIYAMILQRNYKCVR